MIQNIIRHLGGIDRYGVLSLCIFGTLFVGVLLWALLQKRSHLDYMSRAALDNDPEEPSNPRNPHE